MAVTGAHRVPVYSPRADPAAPPAVNDVVHANDDRTIGDKPFDDNTEQSPRRGTGAPTGAIENLVIACKVGGLSPAGHAQAGGNGPLARCQHGAHHQNEHMLPAGSRETGAPRLEPPAQHQGNGIAD